MRPATTIVRSIRQSEKGTRIAVHRQYILDVASDANKIEIRQAVQEIFQVTVQKVNTHISHGKWRRLSAHWGRRPDRKRAIVTLAAGQKIEFKS